MLYVECIYQTINNYTYCCSLNSHAEKLQCMTWTQMVQHCYCLFMNVMQASRSVCVWCLVDRFRGWGLTQRITPSWTKELLRSKCWYCPSFILQLWVIRQFEWSWNLEHAWMIQKQGKSKNSWNDSYSRDCVYVYEFVQSCVTVLYNHSLIRRKKLILYYPGHNFPPTGVSAATQFPRKYGRSNYAVRRYFLGNIAAIRRY